MGATPAFGQIPSSSAGAGTQVFYYGAGLAVGAVFGLIGLGLGALAGAGTGYLGTPQQPVVPPASVQY